MLMHSTTTSGASIVCTSFPPNAEDCTPDDEVVFDQPSLIRCEGAAGSVVVTPWGNQPDRTYDLEVGEYVPLMVRAVKETSTGTGLVRYW